MQYPQPQLNLDLGLDEASRYHDASRFGFFSVLYDTGRRNGKGYTIKKQESYLLRDMADVLPALSGSYDIWLSQCEFRKPNRRAVNFLRTGTSYIDLDYYKIDGLKHPMAVMSKVFDVLESEGIPLPNLVIDSGRGLQIKWIYPSIPDRALLRWKAVQNRLIEILRGLGSDPAVKDVSRVLRLAGTFNSKSRSMVQVLYSEDPLKSFDKLADAVLPFSRQAIADLREKRRNESQLELVTNNPKPIHRGGLHKKSLSSLYWNRFLDLRKLCRMRGGLVPSIQEDKKNLSRTKMLIFQLNFMLLSGATNPQQLWNEAQAVSSAIDPGWKPDQHRLTTLLRKAQSHAAGETVILGDKTYSPLYTPRSATLIDMFHITPDEERELTTIISKTERDRRRRDRHEAARRALGAVPREEYEASSLSRHKPWEKLGMSRATWYRQGKPLS